MAKTEKELSKLRDELDRLREQLCELTDEELEKVIGGFGFDLDPRKHNLTFSNLTSLIPDEP